MNPYWLLRAFVKTPNISHATTTGLESAGEKQLNPTVPELIENLPVIELRGARNKKPLFHHCNERMVGIAILQLQQIGLR